MSQVLAGGRKRGRGTVRSDQGELYAFDVSYLYSDPLLTEPHAACLVLRVMRLDYSPPVVPLWSQGASWPGSGSVPASVSRRGRARGVKWKTV